LCDMGRTGLGAGVNDGDNSCLAEVCGTAFCGAAFDRIERAENFLRTESGETGDNREESAAVDRSFEAISTED